MCKLGAGTGLPGLYAFTRGAQKVILTDDPDETILGCLWSNLRRNIDEENVLTEDGKANERWCTVDGYKWGTNTDVLKQ